MKSIVFCLLFLLACSNHFVSYFAYKKIINPNEKPFFSVSVIAAKAICDEGLQGGSRTVPKTTVEEYKLLAIQSKRTWLLMYILDRSVNVLTAKFGFETRSELLRISNDLIKEITKAVNFFDNTCNRDNFFTLNILGKKIFLNIADVSEMTGLKYDNTRWLACVMLPQLARQVDRSIDVLIQEMPMESIKSFEDVTRGLSDSITSLYANLITSMQKLGRREYYIPSSPDSDTYKVVERIYSSAMSVVLKVTTIGNNKPASDVIIKKVLNDHTKENENRLKNEYDSISRIGSHPNIISFDKILKCQDGSSYEWIIVEEYLAGSNLQAVIFQRTAIHILYALACNILFEDVGTPASYRKVREIWNNIAKEREQTEIENSIRQFSVVMRLLSEMSIPEKKMWLSIQDDVEEKILNIISSGNPNDVVFLAKFKKYIALYFNNMLASLSLLRSGQVDMVFTPFSEDKACDMLIKLLKAGIFMHQKGVVNRDIKAENIIETFSGELKIIDFGIAKPYYYPSRESAVREPQALLNQSLVDVGAGYPTLSSITPQSIQGYVVGTSGYLCPEILNDREKNFFDLAMADQWAFGVLGYLMVAGNHPFSFESPFSPEFSLESEGRSVRRIADINPGINEAFAQIIERSLSKDSGDRYQSLEEFLYALEDWKYTRLHSVSSSTPTMIRGIPKPVLSQKTHRDMIEQTCASMQKIRAQYSNDVEFIHNATVLELVCMPSLIPRIEEQYYCDIFDSFMQKFRCANFSKTTREFLAVILVSQLNTEYRVSNKMLRGFLNVFSLLDLEGLPTRDHWQADFLVDVPYSMEKVLENIDNQEFPGLASAIIMNVLENTSQPQSISIFAPDKNPKFSIFLEQVVLKMLEDFGERKILHATQAKTILTCLDMFLYNTKQYGKYSPDILLRVRNSILAIRKFYQDEQSKEFQETLVFYEQSIVYKYFLCVCEDNKTPNLVNNLEKYFFGSFFGCILYKNGYLVYLDKKIQELKEGGNSFEEIYRCSISLIQIVKGVFFYDTSFVASLEKTTMELDDVYEKQQKLIKQIPNLQFGQVQISA